MFHSLHAPLSFCYICMHVPTNAYRAKGWLCAIARYARNSSHIPLPFELRKGLTRETKNRRFGHNWIIFVSKSSQLDWSGAVEQHLSTYTNAVCPSILVLVSVVRVWPCWGYRFEGHNRLNPLQYFHPHLKEIWYFISDDTFCRRKQTHTGRHKVRQMHTLTYTRLLRSRSCCVVK